MENSVSKKNLNNFGDKSEKFSKNSTGVFENDGKIIQAAENFQESSYKSDINQNGEEKFQTGIKYPDNKLIVSSSPHVSGRFTTKGIMLDVIIALCPALIASVVFFGLYALMITAISVATCVLTEFLFNLIMKKRQTVNDLSAVVTGLILAFNLPPTVPFYFPILGGVFAIVIVKMLFGGIGKNFANPACTARIFLMLSFTALMTKFIAPIDYSGGVWEGLISGFKPQVDGISSVTPLRSGNTDLLSLFLGNVGGCIGETSKLAILIGFAYLLIRRVIDFKVPVIYMLSFMCFTYIFTGKITDVPYQLLSGGLMFGAVFMATDYSTSPNSAWGNVVYALGLGFITVLLRQFSAMPEGTSYAIVFMNLFVPIIDKYLYNKPFGLKKKNVKAIVIVSIMAAILLAVLIVGICEGCGVVR